VSKFEYILSLVNYYRGLLSIEEYVTVFTKYSDYSTYVFLRCFNKLPSCKFRKPKYLWGKAFLRSPPAIFVNEKLEGLDLHTTIIHELLHVLFRTKDERLIEGLTASIASYLFRKRSR